MAMPDFIKKKIDAKKGADDASASASDDASASESPSDASASPAPKGKMNPLMKWAQSKKG